MGGVKVLHVVGTFQIFDDVAPPRTAKGLNRIKLALLHARRVASFHYWYTLARVDLVGAHGVAVQVPDTFYWKYFTIQLDLVGLHDLLHGFADVA